MKQYPNISVQVHCDGGTCFSAEEADGCTWIRVGHIGITTSAVLFLSDAALDNLAQACQDLAMLRAKIERKIRDQMDADDARSDAAAAVRDLREEMSDGCA